MARGPAYPYVGLQQAVELSRKMYNFTKRTPSFPDAVIKEAWEYSPTSSSGQKVLAALRYFGLVEDVAGGENKQIKLTDRAYRILVDSPESPERVKALRDAALMPKAYAYCWKKWDGDTPPSMRSHLIFDQGFNEGTVDSFLRDYRETIKFANLTSFSSEENIAEAPESSDRQILATSNEIGPMKEIKAKEESSAPQKSQKDTGTMWTEVFNLPEGVVTIQIPPNLSEESFQDFVDGLELFKRKIGRIVAKAEAKRKEEATFEREM